MSGTMVSTQDMMNGLNAPTTPTFIQTNLVSDGSVPATKKRSQSGQSMGRVIVTYRAIVDFREWDGRSKR